LDPELKMMLETTGKVFPLRPPALPRQFGVPRQFDIGTLLVITAMYAVLFAVLRAFEATPLTFTFIALFFTSVGLGQAILFEGRRPQRASVIVGACFLSCWALVSELLWPSPRPRLSTGDILWFSLLASLPGALLGYTCGGFIAIVLFMSEKTENRGDNPNRQK